MVSRASRRILKNHHDRLKAELCLAKEKIAESEKTGLDNPDLLAIWDTISQRRAGYDSLMWQAPALGTAAQAFLLGFALDGSYPNGVRIFFCTVSLVVAVVVIQFFVKNRRNEMLDSFLLEEIETRLGFKDAIGVIPNGKPSERYTEAHYSGADRFLKQTLPLSSRFGKMNTFKIWLYIQWLFAVSAFVVLVYVALKVFGIDFW